jgi:amidase
MANSLSTIETLMEAYLGAEPWKKDPVLIPAPWDTIRAQEPQRPLRIGYYADDGVVLPQPPIQSSVHLVVERLKAAGHHGMLYYRSRKLS